MIRLTCKSNKHQMNTRKLKRMQVRCKVNTLLHTLRDGIGIIPMNATFTENVFISQKITPLRQ